ncbi:unnamed protein product, partial [marine sediment metagenome]
LKHVTADVIMATAMYQTPQRLSQLARDFYFRRDARALAYEEELAKLRAQLAQLQPPASDKRFAIVSPDQIGERKTSPLISTGTPVVARNADTTKTLTAPKPPVPPTSEPDSAQPDVIVSINRARAAIVRKLRISPDGKLLALGGEDGIIRILNVDNVEVLKAIHAHSGRISDLDFTSDNQTLMSAGRDGFLRFWNVTTGQKALEELQIKGAVPYSARLNPRFANRFVLMGDKAGRLYAWDLSRNRRLITNGKFHSGPVHSVAYQPGGSGTFLSAGGDGLLKARLPEGTRLTVHAHSGPIFSAGYNSNGTLVYSAGMDRRIKLWDPTTLARELPKAELEGHLKYVISAAVSPDGTMMASGGGDKAINVWDIETGKLIGHFLGHTTDIESISFTPNGRFIISASEDKTVRIWSVEDKKELIRMAFKADSDKFAGATYDNRAFGDRDSGLMSIYVDGRVVSDEEGDRVIKYIGHGIVIVDNAGETH